MNPYSEAWAWYRDMMATVWGSVVEFASEHPGVALTVLAVLAAVIACPVRLEPHARR